MRTPHPCPTLVAVAVLLASCVEESPGAAGPTRETLPSGAVLVRYPDLPAIDSVGPGVTEVRVDLQFGSRDGSDPNLTFGDIRGIQAASDGTIYVLDAQAVEVRVFDPGGRYLRTIARRGEGPGEIMEANGILLSGDTLLWMHDVEHWAIIGVDPNGAEMRRFAKPVFGFAYFWPGTFDRRGRYWSSTFQGRNTFVFAGEPPVEGVNTSTSQGHYKSYDPSSGAVDSVQLGERVTRWYVYGVDGGWGVMSIPFEAHDIARVSPSGGFWHANSASYRIIRTSEDGDTLVVIEAGLAVRPVTAEDRSAYVERTVEDRPERLRDAERVAALMSDYKPILENLFVDDEGRLWVERATPADAPTFYDLFSDDGEHLGSVRLPFISLRPRRGLWVQHSHIYTWVADEMDVPYVVRAPLR